MSNQLIHIFLLFHLWSIALADIVKMEACQAFQCGSVSISYPFWISSHQEDYCGYPSLEINCRDEKPFLTQSYDSNYHIDRVFYDNNSFVLINSILENWKSNCSVPNLNVSLGLGPLVVSRANKELVFFSNCTNIVAPSADYLRLHCDAEQPNTGNESFVRLFQNYSDNAVPGEELSNCSISEIPVSGWNGTTGDEYRTLMNDGFLVELRVTSCSDCHNSHGECGFNTSNAMFTCICPDGNMYSRSCQDFEFEGTNGKKKAILIVSATGGASIFIFICLVFICMLRRCKNCAECIIPRKCRPQRNIEMLLEKYGSVAPKRYKYSEVKKITRSFQDTLGKGGFGTVYKGSLRDGRLVAVKVLHNSTSHGDEFLNEVISIGRTSHINVVSLLGFCIEGSKHALIYEYMPNGSLEHYIYSENPKAVLGWERLYGIAIGIARGLEYLHQHCNARIVHFDIKPQNILLDEDFNPKIADFGLTKLCPPKESILSMGEMRGTIGFIAPEVFSRSFGVVSAKSDVYSYGMMVLEMVGGRKNVKQSAENSSQMYFPHWLYDRLVEGGQIQTCDVTVDTEEFARKMGVVGLWCTQIMPVHRPSMSRVIEMLEKGLDELEMPPKPCFSSPPHLAILSNSSGTLS